MAARKSGKAVRGSTTGRPVMVLLDLLGKRWTMRILWELRDGPLPFRGLEEAMEGVSPSVLNTRLRELREADLVAHANDREMQLGLVTTTSQPNIDAIAEAAGAALGLDRFDVVITRDDVAEGKPSPECYEVALERLDVAADDALAIEDTAASASAAIGAGIATIVTPGAFTDDQFVIGAALVLPSLLTDGALDPEVLQLLD